jgi:hypothetical protein
MIVKQKLHFAIAGVHTAGLVEYQREERLVNFFPSCVKYGCVAFHSVFARRNGQVCVGFMMREMASLIVKA